MRRPSASEEVHAVRRRIYYAGWLFVLVSLLLCGRAFYLQILCAPQWQERASTQHRKIIRLTPQRGAIYDCQGEPLAVSLEADSLYANPSELDAALERLGQSVPALKNELVAERSRYAAAVAKYLKLDSRDVAKRLDRDKKFVWLERRITSEQSRQLEQLHLPLEPRNGIKSLEHPGLHFIREHKRWYPNGHVAGQIVGFSGVDNDGLEGLERYYDGIIAGDGSYLICEKDASGQSLGSGEQVVKGQLGRDLYLTIDKQIQYLAERELAEAVRSTASRSGSVVVVEPDSGRILALASWPNFDPNKFGQYSAAKRRLRPICDTYEPGSTFKLFLLAAAMNEKVVTAQQQIDCGRGSYRVGGKVIHDHRPLGRLSVADVLKYSSNIGSAKIGAQLGKETFYQYLRNFGFAQKTGIDFDGEGTGILRRPADWFEVDLAAISFGQGVTVTPLQLAMATSAIVNGGRLMKPYLVEKVVDPRSGSESLRRPEIVRQVLKPEVAEQVREMMVRVTDDDGTGQRAQVEGFQVGGKTGTAQKVDPLTGTYSPDKHIVSFVGFAPASAPRLTILVTLDEPHGETYGGIAAAPVFARIAEQSLRYLRVPAERTAGHEPAVPLKPVARLVPAMTSLERGTGGGGEVARAMPDFRGMSAAQALALMAQSGLNVRIEGAGRVVEQTPAPGSLFNAEMCLTIRLQPPEVRHATL
ncbi:MAG: transpeptidase family protein [Desulfuromonadaceae bacterium]|nr:transpeptidase family protein [Desulfuromonadaceae bacterium]